jgi:hypothetical protein
MHATAVYVTVTRHQTPGISSEGSSRLARVQEEPAPQATSQHLARRRHVRSTRRTRTVARHAPCGCYAPKGACEGRGREGGGCSDYNAHLPVSAA